MKRGAVAESRRRCCHGGWCRRARSRSGWWRPGDVMRRGAVAASKRRCCHGGWCKNDDAMRVWRVVKLSTPLTNAPLMKTGRAMADMRRKMVEVACSG